MEEKEIIQRMYIQFKKDCGYQTIAIFNFIIWLHREKDQAKYLLEMNSLGIVERDFIEQVVNGLI